MFGKALVGRQLCVLILVSLLAASATAATFNVPSGSYPTIQSGVSAAGPGDTVLIACGTYYEYDIALSTEIVIRGATGLADCVVIDAQQQGRIFYSYDLDGNKVSIENITMRGGLQSGALPDPKGGGIYLRYGSLWMVNCRLVDNVAAYEGGGMWIRECELDMYDCDIDSNESETSLGGGILATHMGSMNVERCVITGNESADDGGGIILIESPANIVECDFIGNSSNNFSGGIDLRGSTWPYFVSHCTFDRNSANYSGGGMSALTVDGSSVEYCTFSNNSAVFEGGGIYVGNLSFLSLSNCTFADNVAPSGAGIALGWGSNPSTAVLDKVIIADGISGEAVYCDANCSATLTCCDIYGNDGGDYVGCISGQGGVNGNFSEDPLFCRAANPLDPYTLRPSSPCLPANNSCTQLIGAHDTGCEDMRKLIDQEQTCWMIPEPCHQWQPGHAQTFRPSVDKVDAVQLLLGAADPGVPTEIEVTLRIWDGFTILATTTATVSPPDVSGYPEWFQIHFDSSIDVIPGKLYGIFVREVTYESNVHWWHCDYAEAYTRGAAWINPENGVNQKQEWDFCFKTEYYGYSKLVDQYQTLWTDDYVVGQWPPGHGQAFQPTADILDAVKVLLAANLNRVETDVEVTIYHGFPGPGAPPLTNAIATICPPYIGSPEWFQFHFPNTVELIPGSTYWLTVKEINHDNNVRWHYIPEDPTDHYPPGTGLISPGPEQLVFPYEVGLPFLDWAFMTEYYGYICGDADGSGNVDIDDVVFLIAYIFTGGPAPDPYLGGDANCSEAIDIDDVVYLIAYIFTGGPAPCDPDGDTIPDC